MRNRFETDKALGAAATGYAMIEVGGSEAFRNTLGEGSQEIAGGSIDVNAIGGTELGHTIENILEIGVDQVAPIALVLALSYIGLRTMFRGFSKDSAR